MTTKTRTRIGYLILCVLGLAIFFGYIATKYMQSPSDSLPGIYEFLYILFVLPCASAIYGILSYILTKRVLIPNLIFAVLFVFLVIFSSFDSHFFEELIESIPLLVIIFFITIIFSFITKLIVTACRKNKKQKYQ